MRSLERPGSNLAGEIPTPSEPQPTSEEIPTTGLVGLNTDFIFNIQAPQPPPERLLIHTLMTFEDDVVRMRAIEANISVDEEAVQDAFRALVEGVKQWLESSRDEQAAQILHRSPDTWFRFVSPAEAHHLIQKRLAAEGFQEMADESLQTSEDNLGAGFETFPPE